MSKNDANEAQLCHCKICGSHQDLGSYDKRALIYKKMKEEQLCFTCAFWKDKIDNPVANREIINGCHYTFHPWIEKPQAFLGHAGSPYYVLRNDGTVARSNNVWFQGNIPERFRTQLPDTAKLITRHAYYKIIDEICFSCPKKGCWDRHHCYFYHKDEYEPDGPYNIVPDNYKIGGEKCALFLDKTKMYLDDQH